MHPIFVALLTGHLVGDFLLQNKAMLEKKSRISGCMLHAAIVAAVSWLLLGAVRPAEIPMLAVAVFLVHFLVDMIKRRWESGGVYVFLIDCPEDSRTEAG